MADLLSTTWISDYVTSFKNNETTKRVQPLNTQKTKYQNLSNAYSVISSKLTLLKTTLSDFKLTGTSSVFSSKSAISSNTNFITTIASSSAAKSTFSLRIEQLAKTDSVISQMLDSSTSSTLSGKHSFTINTGDGKTGEYSSSIEVEFDSDETNQTAMEKIRDAINSDYAVVNSSYKTGTDVYAGGASTFKIDLNGTETEITVNGGGTYSELLDEITQAITSKVSGVTAKKVEDSSNPGNYKLELTVNDTSKYISISHVSGNDLVTDLNIGATKEKAASGTITASVFTPSTGNSQLSITTKETGLDYRIKSISDDASSSALSALGLNLGASRPSFDQSTNTSGFSFADITSSGNLLNAKVKFNNIDIQKNSNTISDLASGVTFTLKSVMTSSDNDVIVTTSNNVSSIKSKVQEFIARFNDIYSYLKTNSSYNSGSRGLFTMDRNTLSLVNDLKSAVFNDVSGLSTDDLKRLSEIGVSFNATSGLSITDGTLLEKNLTDNISEVEALFNSENGIANSLYEKIEPYLGATGYIANSQSSFSSNLTQLNTKIKRTQESIDKRAEVLREKYEKLQAQLAAVYTMQQWLSQGGFFSS